MYDDAAFYGRLNTNTSTGGRWVAGADYGGKQTMDSRGCSSYSIKTRMGEHEEENVYNNNLEVPTIKSLSIRGGTHHNWRRLSNNTPFAARES